MKIRGLTTLWMALIASLTMAAPMRAQQVTAALSPQVIGSGQASEFTISIEGAQQVQGLQNDLNVAGLEFSGPQQRNQMTVDNGVMRQQIEFVWQVFAAKAGTYTIPAQQVKVNGQVFTTQQKTLQVQEGEGPKVLLDPFLKIHVDQTEIYVGQVVPVSVTAFFHRKTQLRNYDHPKLVRDNFVIKRFPPAGPSATVEINGERYQPIMFSSSLSALKDGDLELGPAELDCQVDFPTDDRGNRTDPQGFPQSFFQRVVTRQFHLKSDALKLTVKPLPDQGRPADFAGAVGRFALTSRATPLQLKVGDPIAVDLTVTGQGNFDSLTPPLLGTTEGWKLYPSKVTQENRMTGLEPGAVSYSQVIIPQKLTTEVPAFYFSYFDPDQRQYITARSNPIPLQMAPEDKPEVAAKEAPTKDFSITDATIPEEQLADILTLRREDGTLRDLVPSHSDDALLWGAQAVPAALVLAFAAVGLQRRLRINAEDKRRRDAGHPRPCGLILRDLRKPGRPLREFYALASEYVDAWEYYHARPGARAALNGDLESIFERQNRYSYAGLGPEAASPVPPPEQDEVVETLSRLGSQPLAVH